MHELTTHVEHIMRGLTVPCVWFDEFAFLGFNDIIYKAMKPALNKACELAKKCGKNYGLLITTTPRLLGSILVIMY